MSALSELQYLRLGDRRYPQLGRLNFMSPKVSRLEEAGAAGMLFPGGLEGFKPRMRDRP